MLLSTVSSCVAVLRILNLQENVNLIKLGLLVDTLGTD